MQLEELGIGFVDKESDSSWYEDKLDYIGLEVIR